MDSGKGKMVVLKGWGGRGRKRTNALFSRKELSQFVVSAKGHDFVELRCGLTSRKFGDYGGKVKIFRDGRIRIRCERHNGCTADDLTISEFEEHTSPPGGRIWLKGHVWIFTSDGRKVALHKTCMLKYYKGSPRDSWVKIKPRRGRTVHRNEFISCTKCNKRRRFLLNTKEDCRIYHQASLSRNWTCADFTKKKISCDDAEERAAKLLFRGCPTKPLCKGCAFCVCFGCTMCRFKDCDCRTCVDYIVNVGDEISDDEEDESFDEEEDEMTEEED